MSGFLKAIVILLVVACMACKKKSDIIIDRNLIRSISNEDRNFPSRFYGCLFFCKCDSSKIAQFNPQDIYLYYQTLNENIQYENFLTEVLDQKRTLNCKDKFETFDLSQEVEEKYNKMGFNDFLKYYCLQKESDRYWIRHEVKGKDFNTLLYFLFINNYLVFRDDYAGIYTVRPMSSLFEK